MSQKPVDRNPDLRRLRDAGYNVDVRDGYLVVAGIPYVDQNRRVLRGTLVSELTMTGDLTQPPSTHVVHFAGSYPCTHEGQPIEKIRNQSAHQEIAPGLFIDHTFSSKPRSGRYVDYFEKVNTYAMILASQAHATDPDASPLFFSPIAATEDDSAFNYIDTASSRAGIVLVNQKLAGHRIAIFGVGGTGSYVLDFIAKTPVAEIHLFDGDRFQQHNAFRAPGAASLEDLEKCMYKVDYLAAIYSRMRRGLIPHPQYVTRAELGILEQIDFVFLCMDAGPAKRLAIDALIAANKPFIDVGMGIELVDDVLTGMARVTVSVPGHRAHVENCISCADNGRENVYAKNIQIVEMNALNAALAVICWKKYCGFYFDPLQTYNLTFMISTMTLIKDEVANDDVAA